MVGVTGFRPNEPIPLPEAALPREAGMQMPVQDLRSLPDTARTRRRDPHAWMPRLFVFGGAALVAGLLIHEMYAVLTVARMTPIEAVMLALFAINISWIALAFTTALAGMATLLSGRHVADVPPQDGRLPNERTAILIPAYNENAAQVFAAAAAIGESLAEADAADCFDIFVLSDTTDPDAWIAEEAAFRAVLRRPGKRARVFYRRRHRNTERKAGNVADWCKRFGAAYPCFVVLDADSLMEADTLVRMALAMEADPALGLLQTVPAVVNRNTLFARLQQFAGRVYGPVMSAGLAAWARRDGNYWGHNAIIRTRAFAESAGLPHLRGRPPFGGHILSHDFVEAALMRRAGWDVVLAPTLGGSYEESPPSLIDLATRDRRWCQGNLQHAKVLFARGLRWPSRAHMAMGIMSYVASPVWLIFLIAGLLLALQAQFIRPEYFTDEFQLFPTWPSIDSERAIGLFLMTMTILFLPKLFGLAVALCNGALRRGLGGPARAVAGVLTESVVSALLAPIMMAIQSGAVADTLMGRDAGWQPQRRDDGSVPFSEVFRRHRAHMGLGIVLGGSAWAVSPQVFAWMSPAVAGLVLAAALSALTARRDVGLALRRIGILTIPEERSEPDILRRAEAAAADLAEAMGPPREACMRLSADPALLAFHRASLVPDTPHGRGGIDETLVLGLARLENAQSLEDAVRYLSPREKLAVLANPEGLDHLALLPRAEAAE
ncbi:glucans biosynthesis glucosyltransferase MdoH [Microbaculum marinum]|uniref:Glucans biosynthesis glucosyltransferase H n=1 Tax=Microbaculum marinum TaxID=1764581 RepID=A0AAW9RY06_9HYPH